MIYVTFAIILLLVLFYYFEYKPNSEKFTNPSSKKISAKILNIHHPSRMIHVNKSVELPDDTQMYTNNYNYIGKVIAKINRTNDSSILIMDNIMMPLKELQKTKDIILTYMG